MVATHRSVCACINNVDNVVLSTGLTARQADVFKPFLGNPCLVSKADAHATTNRKDRTKQNATYSTAQLTVHIDIELVFNCRRVLSITVGGPSGEENRAIRMDTWREQTGNWEKEADWDERGFILNGSLALIWISNFLILLSNDCVWMVRFVWPSSITVMKIFSMAFTFDGRSQVTLNVCSLTM